MRRVIWRPRAVSRRALALIAIIALGGVYQAERVIVRSRQPHYELKLRAAELAEQAMIAVKEERIARGYPIDASVDPAETGLVGLPYSDVTSIAGNLASKQTSINPNFAAVVLEMLKELNVQEGDKVAVGVSGSFPALNICVYSALQTLKADPVIIASGAASQWGANFDDFLWIDMERELFDCGLDGWLRGPRAGDVQYRQAKSA
jgi:poly-gamma-glutamate system protein